MSKAVMARDAPGDGRFDRADPRSVDGRTRQVMMPLHEIHGGTDQPQLRGQWQVGGGAADLHTDAARFDDPAVPGVNVGELLGRKAERDGAALSGIEPDAAEPAELQDREGDRGLLVADV